MVQLIPRENARADVARALVLREVFGTPYSETPLYVLERALARPSAEYRIAEQFSDDVLAGLALFGSIAGTIGTARIYLVAPTEGPARDAAKMALQSALQTLRDDGARLMIAELPDDPCMAEMRRLLLECGFREESRVDDLFRAGVALTFLRLDLP